jgi:hypothetical protein
MDEFEKWLADRECYFSDALFVKNYSLWDIKAAFDYQQAKLDEKDREITELREKLQYKIACLIEWEGE